MLKFTEIKLKEHYPGVGRGMKPGYRCAVTLQIGERSYDTVTIDLTTDEVREVVAVAVAKAVARLTFDPSSIDVEGAAGEPHPDETPPTPTVVDVDPATPEIEAQEAF